MPASLGVAVSQLFSNWLCLVRTPLEVSAGFIESEWGANVPLSVIWSQFQLPEDEFESTYGVRKPALDDEIIVTCRSGGRSTVAQKILRELGYTNVLNFKTEDGKNGGCAPG